MKTNNTLLVVALLVILDLVCCSQACAQVQQAWAVTYTNGGASAIKVDGAGNVYVSGSVGTVKYDAAGNWLWAVTNNNAVALELDEAGNVHVTGEQTVKYDSQGNRVWFGEYPDGGTAAALA